MIFAPSNLELRFRPLINQAQWSLRTFSTVTLVRTERSKHVPLLSAVLIKKKGPTGIMGNKTTVQQMAYDKNQVLQRV